MPFKFDDKDFLRGLDSGYEVQPDIGNEEDLDARPRKSRTPLKQIIPRLREGRTEAARIFVEDYERALEKEKKRQEERKAEEKRVERKRAKEDPAKAIDKQAEKRLKALKVAVKYRRGDKQLEQLVGREQEITEFWKAMKLAELKLGRPPKDSEIAETFASLRGEPGSSNKDKARTRRKLIAELENKPLVWGSSFRENVSRDSQSA
jgi:hypothetical protein